MQLQPIVDRPLAVECEQFRCDEDAQLLREAGRVHLENLAVVQERAARLSVDKGLLMRALAAQMQHRCVSKLSRLKRLQYGLNRGFLL